MSDTLTEGAPEVSKEALRAQRLDNVLTEADQAPDPEAPAALTEADQAGLDTLHASEAAPEPEHDMKHILDLRAANEAKQAEADAARLATLKAHEAAGGVVYTQGQTSEATAAPAEAPAAEATGSPKKQSWLKKLFGGNKEA